MVYKLPIAPTGPAADPKYLPSIHETNPYKFFSQLLQAAHLPPKNTDRHVFFFGYEGSDPHVALQQWFPSPFKATRASYHEDDLKADSTDLVLFPTSEHFMMYHKALLMSDSSTASQILADPHPSSAKSYGRQVKNFIQDLWIAHADEIVEAGNFFKFSQRKELRDMLVGTGERDIVEASPDDRRWGIGFDSEEAAGIEKEWGNNGLGKALMKVRERLRYRFHGEVVMA